MQAQQQRIGKQRRTVRTGPFMDASRPPAAARHAPWPQLLAAVGNRVAGQLQRRAPAADAIGPVPRHVARAIDRPRRGAPLPRKARRPGGRSPDADRGAVRRLTGSGPEALNRLLPARAYTAGQDIFFRQGPFRPQNGRGRAPLAHGLKRAAQQAPDSGREVIQRKVGFEFEDNEWKTWIKESLWSRDRRRYWKTEQDRRGVRAAKKKEVLHRGTGFNAEADIEPPTSDLEFVTEAFEETPAGTAALQQTLVEIKNIYLRLGQVGGRDHKTGNFVTQSEHGFSNSQALLSEGAGGRSIKMHVTQGIPLAQLPTLMAYLGTNVAGETAVEQQQRAPARLMQYGPNEEAANAISEVLGASPAMADQALHDLQQNPALAHALAANTGQLRGFLALVLNYVRLFSLKIPQGVAKYRTTLMSRTELGAIFKTLPRDQRRALSQHANVFEQVILQVADQARSAAEDPYQANLPLFRGFRRHNAQHQVVVLAPDLTVSIWLQNLLQGRDLATAARISGWLSRHGTQDKATNREDIERLRGLGGLGGKMDRRGAALLPILENRGVSPRGVNRPAWVANPKDARLTFDEATNVALNYTEFLSQLRQNQIGAFPQVQYQFV